jgi:hypothetical protein
MEGLGVLLVVVAAFLANLPALREQWHSDRAGFIKTIWLLGLYFLYIGLGLAVLFLLKPPAGTSDRGLPPSPLRASRRVRSMCRSRSGRGYLLS